MSSINSITIEKLERLVGLPNAPVLMDVRLDEDFDASPFLIPASYRCHYESAAEHPSDYRGRRVVVICQKGKKLSEGVAALLRSSGIDAEVLTGGYLAWREAGLPVFPIEKLPARHSDGSSVWVTRERPKIDRVACPWLIRRFIDPKATFLFVSPAEVTAVGDRFGATPFDIEDVFWSHRGTLCTFDVMVAEFGLASPAMLHLALIVRAADTARPDLAPEAAGLLAISLGLSRSYRSDLAQLEAALPVYDALYRWCRDATDEKHNWPQRSGKA